LKGKGSVFFSVTWHCPVVSPFPQTDNAKLVRGEEAGEAMHAAVDDVYLRNASIVFFKHARCTGYHVRLESIGIYADRTLQHEIIRDFSASTPLLDTQHTLGPLSEIIPGATPPTGVEPRRALSAPGDATTAPKNSVDMEQRANSKKEKKNNSTVL
jgi:hypothetical protein